MHPGTLPKLCATDFAVEESPLYVTTSKNFGLLRKLHDANDNVFSFTTALEPTVNPSELNAVTDVVLEPSPEEESVESVEDVPL